MAHRPPSFRPLRLLFTLALLTTTATLTASDASAYVNQADGTVVPQTSRLQACLDLPATGETTVGAVNAIADASVLPEAYRPVLDAASGHYRVSFVDIGEGAGFRNSFGWFWVGTDVTNPANLFTIFGCRTYATCDCPCTTTRTVTIDFDTQPGFAAGRPIGFWLRTPERLDASREGGTFPTGCSLPVGCDPTGANVDDSCGGRRDTNNRIYFTSQALNDDGDFKHFLVYRSATRVDTYYFGFEDLYRGGDNDYEDMLVRGTGLVPECDPRPETCNAADDDCDLNVDEGLTMACSTPCGTGVRTCTAGSFGACSARTPTTESCNNADDDCDSSTDEGLSRACSNTCGTGTEICVAGTYAMCSARTPSIEDCDGVDDDCDGTVDEMISRACSSDCGAGTQVCTAGSFGACSAPAPGTETCNAGDDDCDGRVDEGLIRDCSNACGSGFERCAAGAYVECTAPDPGVEACNAIDDDCDGNVDEGLVQACSSVCGVGTETCSAGSWIGCDAPGPSVEVCNNVDDDCDGVIDDGNPGGGAACTAFGDGGFETDPDGGAGGGPDGGIACTNGRVVCVEGALECRGATSGSRELCNCLDDDCDGRVDEETSEDPLCPGGACVASECACADPCASEEFPCPPGRVCDRTLADPSMGIIGYCVAGRCAGVTCGDEEVCNPETGACENLCESITCGSGYACVRGACVEDNCYGRGCPAGQVCRTASAGATPACVDDPCSDVSCPAGEYCSGGTCEPPCGDGCAPDEICVDGACEADPCGGACGEAQSCIEGECVNNACVPGCGRGRVCRGDVCIDDPCTGVRCPDGYECALGACTREGPPRPVEPTFGAAAGGGGCICSVPGAPGGPGSGAMGAIALLGVALLARSRARRRWARAVGTAGALALVLGGCDVDPYCFAGCGEGTDGAIADAGTDARVVTTDGCVATGDEECNDRDDDCDGRIDEGFDTQTDPGNCGACGTVCMLPHAFPSCTAGECTVDRCEIGWHDIDDVPANGCEYGCPPAGGVELCNGADDDCDATTDEGFDLTSDLANCGGCGNVCEFANAAASCVSSACVMGACRAGFVDLDGMPETGCEYRCTASGVEACNGVDDDCDRTIDEGFDRTSDPANCGTCGHACAFPHVAMPRCAAGSCAFGPGDCEPGYLDVDRDPSTGCEYMCTPTGGIDDCDRIDDDCDGIVDESDPMIGTSCGTATGACETGTTACVRGALACAGGIGPTGEICNAADDDCDGRTDESTAAAPIPGLGVRCGATDVGACSYGTVQCSAGSLSCGGTLVTATTETCNGVDDDCDGALDDGLTPPPRASVPSCAETRGVCAGRTPTCRGAAGWGCDLPSRYQATETRCDGVDNDCDGTTDELCLTPVGSDVRLDSMDGATAANSLDPAIAGTGSGATARLHVVWRDLSADTRTHTWTTRSLDGGGTWGTPVRLDTTTGGTFAPSVVIPGATNVAWAWPDFRGGTGYREIYSRTSATASAATMTLASEVKINGSGPTATTDSFGVVLATVGTNVYAAYESFTGSRSRHVFFSRSTNLGVTWSTPVQLSTPTSTTFVAAEPRIAAAGSDVYVVWRDNRSGSLDIELRRSNDSGATFAAEQRIDTGDVAGTASSFSPAIAAVGSSAWVVWVDDRDMGSFDVWMNRTSNDGGTWLASAVQLDADPLRHDSIEPHVVVSGTNPIVTWIDYRAGFPDVFTTRSTSGGMTWSAPERLDTGTMPGASGSYELATEASGNLVVAAWSDDRSGFLDVYANYSLDGGATWQPQDYRIDTSTIGTSDSQDPALWVTSNAFHVVWVDHRIGASCPAGSGSGTSCANGDIYYRRVQ